MLTGAKAPAAMSSGVGLSSSQQQLNTSGVIGPQYAAKKRRRPQAKKDKDLAKEETKSNPSKRHRDRLNLELDNLAKLIPFSDEVLNKLDKLSILRLAVSYLRNKAYHTARKTSSTGEVSETNLGQIIQRNLRNELVPFANDSIDSKLSLQALNGFIIVVTQDYNIFYVTETVQDLLGFPQSDVMNQSMLELIHAEDRARFVQNMQLDPTKSAPTDTDQQHNEQPQYAKLGITPDFFQELSDRGMMHRAFICRLRCLLDNSSGFLALHFTGHLRLLPGQNKQSARIPSISPETALFLLASPLDSPSIIEIRTKNFIFRTKHKLDYTPLGVDAKGSMVLGYTEQQLRQRSGYEFVHSADMMHCADAHTKLMRQGESGLTVFRILHRDNKWLWVTASAKLIYRHGRPEYIISTHRPIPDKEGTEHMKKRSSAFRFDFTGLGSLYGESNPIGSQLEAGAIDQSVEPTVDDYVLRGDDDDDVSAAKRAKLDVGGEERAIERTSLYGAMSMQKDELYSESAHKLSADVFDQVTSWAPMPTTSLSEDFELAALLGGSEDDDIGTCFYAISTDDSHLGSIEQPPDLFSAGGRIGRGEPPPLFHPPAPVESKHPVAQTQREVAHVARLARYPADDLLHARADLLAGADAADWKPHHQQPLADFRQPPTRSGFQETFPTKVEEISLAKHQAPFPVAAAPAFTRDIEAASGHVPTASGGNIPHNISDFPKHAAMAYSTVGRPIKASNMQHLPSVTHASLTPSSRKNHQDVEMPTTTSEKQRMVWEEQRPSIQLVGYRHDTVQFDLNKIATAYQTANPLEKVEEYLAPHHRGDLRQNEMFFAAYRNAADRHLPPTGWPLQHAAGLMEKSAVNSCQYQQPHASSYQAENELSEVHPCPAVPKLEDMHSPDSGTFMGASPLKSVDHNSDATGTSGFSSSEWDSPATIDFLSDVGN